MESNAIPVRTEAYTLAGSDRGVIVSPLRQAITRNRVSTTVHCELASVRHDNRLFQLPERNIPSATDLSWREAAIDATFDYK